MRLSLSAKADLPLTSTPSNSFAAPREMRERIKPKTQQTEVIADLSVCSMDSDP